MLWTNPDRGTVAFGDAVILTLICGALIVFWLTHDRAELDQLPMASRLRARWRRIPRAMRRGIGSACLCVLVGAGLAVILNIASH
jgi:hypothetical protein